MVQLLFSDELEEKLFDISFEGVNFAEPDFEEGNFQGLLSFEFLDFFVVRFDVGVLKHGYFSLEGSYLQLDFLKQGFDEFFQLRLGFFLLVLNHFNYLGKVLVVPLYFPVHFPLVKFVVMLKVVYNLLVLSDKMLTDYLVSIRLHRLLSWLFRFHYIR